jgi:hypothetical protein
VWTGVRWVVAIVTVFWIVRVGWHLDVLYMAMESGPDQHHGNFYTCFAIKYVHDLLIYSYLAAGYMILRNVRMHVRTKYGIPTGQLSCNDCGYSYCYPWFVAGQMLRHTTDYDIYPAMACTQYSAKQ